MRKLSLVKLVLCGRAVDACAHRILVVLDHVDDRQLPQLRHVEALVNLTLVGRAIAEIGEAHAAVPDVLMLEGKAGAEAHLRADDAVAAVEAMLDAEHVHRSALAFGNAGLASGQLGHDHLRVNAVGEHVAVVAVAGDDAVLADLQRRLKADCDRLLADIEVAESTNQAKPVKLPGSLLEAADEQHLAIIFEQFGLVGLVPLRLSRAFAIGRRRGCGGGWRG